MVGDLAEGALVTAEVAVLSSVMALAIAVPAGLARRAGLWPLRFVAGLYIEVFRGSSAIVQLYFIFFALPAFGLTLDPLIAGVVTLGLNGGAYGAEIVRGAVAAVPRGQVEAAIALNMSPWLRTRRVVLPQAAVAMLPPVGNLLIDLLKATSLLSLITLGDLAFEGEILRRQSGGGDTLAIFAIELCMYFAMAYAITLCVRALERRLARGRDLGHRPVERLAA